ncbi:MAG: serine hydrolase domain-containing protein [Longimicrobiales bacterium]|nr:serine hydrolase domain-containing protein [Longimicrobiales bacterium]
MARYRSWGLLVVALLATGCGSTTAPADPGRQPDTFIALLRGTAQESQLPAVGAAVVRAAGIEEAGVVGVRRYPGGDSVRLDDRFHLGSDTKAMIATVAGRLVERRMLSWDLSPLEVFPELKGTLHPGYGNLVLKDLLVHRAGIQAYTTGAEWQSLSGFPGADEAERRRAFTVGLLRGAPAVVPGTYLYSNAGYAIAASMLEQVSGRSWKTLLQEEVFGPLGLNTAGFGWPTGADPNQPSGHQLVSGQLRAEAVGSAYVIPEVLGPAGDVSMSVRDFGKFVQAHLQGLMGRNGLLRAETVAYLHEPVGGYAPGWAVGTSGADLWSSHNGSAGTFYAVMQVSHTRDVAVVVVTNVGGTKAADAARALANRLSWN